MHPGKRILRAGWLMDFSYAAMNAVLVKFGLFILLSIFLTASEQAVPLSWQAWISAQPIWVQLPLIIFIADFGYYWAHRVFHTVPSLWKFHAIHHSSEQMDWLASMRNHPIDLIATKAVSLWPVFVLGFSESSIALFTTIFFWQSALIHSNIKLPVGPLKWLVSTPQFHHWHHANLPEAIDKNFAAQLPILDAIFGTMHMPARSVPNCYGTSEPVPAGLVDQIFYPVRRGEKGLHEPPDEINGVRN